MATSTGFEIARATGVCAATGRPIAIGEEFIATLAESATQERLERADYSVDAWRSGARPARLYGHWRAVMESPDAKKKPYIDDAALMDLFEQLAEATEPGRISFRYLLALMLIRKRLLKYEGTKRDGVQSLMLVRIATRADQTPAPVVEVIDPGMNDTAIAEAIEQLTAVMADTQ